MMSDSDLSAGERNCAVVHDLLQRLAAGDVAGAVDLYTEDAVIEFPFTPPGVAARHEGKTDIGRFLGAASRLARRIAFDDVRTRAITADEVLAEYCGDWEMTNGRPYRNTYITIVELRDGRIRRMREFYNPLVVMEALDLRAGERHAD